MLKKLLFTLLAVIMLTSAFSCGTDKPTQQETTAFTRQSSDEKTPQSSDEKTQQSSAETQLLSLETTDEYMLSYTEVDIESCICHEIEDRPCADGKHKKTYLSLEGKFLEILLGLSDYVYELECSDMDDWAEGDRNYGSIIDRYGITKEDFETALKKYVFVLTEGRKASQSNIILPKELYDFELWFEDGYEDSSEFVWSGYKPGATESVTIRCPDDDIHLDSFYTIDGRLIDFVGADKFEAFKDKYAGTENFNVIRFVQEFRITTEQYQKMIERAGKAAGYRVYRFCPEWIFLNNDGEKLWNNNWITEYRAYCRQSSPAFRTKIVKETSADYYSPDGKHIDDYCFCTVSSELISMCTGIEEEKIVYDSLLYSKHRHTFTYADAIDVYSIPKEVFAENVKKLKENFTGSEDEFTMLYGLCEEVAAWYSPDPENAATFICEGYQPPEIDTTMIRCESDKVHRNLYYTIDRKLIEYVTPEKFIEFKDKYAGTEDFNVVNFVKYFNITRLQAMRLFYENTAFVYGPYPYDLNYLYGPEELCERYFSRIVVKD